MPRRRASAIHCSASASARVTAAGRSSLYLATIARASASVVGSGTVGPEPIDGRIVARHVGNRDGDQLRRIGAARQPPALDAREMFAHRVDLADGGARSAAARASPPACRRTRRRPPARSSWRRRRPTSAPAPDRRRPRRRQASSARSAASRPAASGTGWPASIMVTMPRRPPVAVARHRDAGRAVLPAAAVEIEALRHLGHEPAALPAASRMSRPSAAAATAAAGSSPDARPLPRCGTALREMRAMAWSCTSMTRRTVCRWRPMASRPPRLCSAIAKPREATMASTTRPAPNSRPPFTGAWSSICARAPTCRIST